MTEQTNASLHQFADVKRRLAEAERTAAQAPWDDDTPQGRKTRLFALVTIHALVGEAFAMKVAPCPELVQEAAELFGEAWSRSSRGFAWEGTPSRPISSATTHNCIAKMR